MATSATVAARKAITLPRIYVAAWVLDVALALGLFLGALAIRLPYLMQIPTLTDETLEVLYSLRVLEGKPLVLTNYDPYYGSLYNYLVAGAFYAFGKAPETGRVIVTVIGALTVPLAYFFAKTMENRLVGLMVSLMMLTSGGLIYMGHVAYENNTTPFFATATFLAFALALKRGSGKLLVASGFLFGLTMQTHPGVIILAVGLALCFVYAGLFPSAAGVRLSLKLWLKSRWPYLTLLAALIGYSNVIVHSVLHPLHALNVIQYHDYAYEPSPTSDTFLINLQNFGVMVVRMGAGTFDMRSDLLENFLLPQNFLFLAFLAMGAGYAVRRGRAMPVIILLVVGLILPYFNKGYSFPGAARYVTYLYPLLYLLVAVPLAQLLRTAPRILLFHHNRNDRYQITCHTALGLPTIVVWLLLLYMVASPALALMAQYREAERTGTTNEQALSTHRLLRHLYETGVIAEVIVDKKLDQRQFGAGSIQRVLVYLFTLDGTPHRTLDVAVDGIGSKPDLGPSGPSALVLTPETYAAVSAQGQLSLLAITGGEGYFGNSRYATYILQSD